MFVLIQVDDILLGNTEGLTVNQLIEMKPDDFADQTVKAKRKNEELLPNGAPAVFDVIRDDHRLGDDGRLVLDNGANMQRDRMDTNKSLRSTELLSKVIPSNSVRSLRFDCSYLYYH